MHTYSDTRTSKRLRKTKPISPTILLVLATAAQVDVKRWQISIENRHAANRGLKCLCVLWGNQRREDDVFTPWNMWITWLAIFSGIISKIRANCLTHYYHTARVPPARNTRAPLFLPGIKGVFMLGSALSGRNFATKLFPKHWLRSTWKCDYLVDLKHTVGVNSILLKSNDLFLDYCSGWMLSDKRSLPDDKKKYCCNSLRFALNTPVLTGNRHNTSKYDIYL